MNTSNWVRRNRPDIVPYEGAGIRAWKSALEGGGGLDTVRSEISVVRLVAS